MTRTDEVRRVSRRLRDVVEPIAANVYFAKQAQAVIALGAAVWGAIDQIHTLLQNPDINKIIAGFQAWQKQWQPLIDAAFPGAPPLSLPAP